MALLPSIAWSRKVIEHPELGPIGRFAGLFVAFDTYWPTEDFQFAPRRAARVLGVSEDDATDLIDGLAKLGFLAEIPPRPSDRLRRRTFKITFPRTHGDKSSDNTIDR